MKLGTVWECLDSRPGETLSGVVILNPVAGGFEVWPFAGEHAILPVGDDLEDHETALTLRTPEGPIDFQELTLADFNRLEGPLLFDTPEFQNDEELRDWFRTRIVES